MLVDDITLVNLLTKGKKDISEIYLSKKNNSDILFVTKRISRQSIDNTLYYENLQKDINFSMKLNHRNIISFKNIKKTKSHYYIMMEFCNGGNLESCLEMYNNLYHTPFPEEVVQHIMKQIVSAIKYIHDLKIVNKNLKLDNILVKFENEIDKNKLNMQKAQIKIKDFKFARYKNDKESKNILYGTPIYMDPFLIKNMLEKQNLGKEIKELEYDEKVDIWSLGIICYKMLVGNFPFYGKDAEELYSKIEEGSFKLPTYLSKEVISFINSMLRYQPTERLSANELFNHPFLFKNAKDFTRIDINQVSKMVYGGELIINIKDNNLINNLEINKIKQVNMIKMNQKNNNNITNNISNNIRNLMRKNISNQMNNNMANQRIDLLPGEKQISIIIISNNQEVHTSVICKNTDLFVYVELKVYERYPKYKEIENFFTVNGNKINKYKSLDENKIKDNDIILLNTIE